MIRPWCMILPLLLATLAGIPLAATLATDWPTFRGADRTAVSKETGLLQEWPEEGPPLVWQAEGTGRGYTSLAIAGDRIFLLGDGIAGVDEGDEYLLCQSRKDGHRLWQTKTGPAWDKGNPTWQSSRSTPTVDKDRVYALTAGGELICCDAATGAEQWRKNLKADFGGKKADGWGYSESVLIDGDRLICTPGGEKTTMAALDKRTGETIWTTVREGDRGAGHASAVIAEIGGVRVYVQTTGGGALGVPRIGRQAAVVLPDRQDYGRRPDADHFERPGFLFRRLQARRRCSSSSQTGRGESRSKRSIRSKRSFPISTAASCWSTAICSAIPTLQAFPSAPT